MVPDAADLAKTIQLSLAPVFLLTGIAGLLSVMTGRLARIIDRGRAFAEGRVVLAFPDHGSIALERQTLEQRRHLTSVAITATTFAALLVCVVIATLFVEVMLETPLKWLVSALFAGAMLTMVVGLAFFLREVHLAMHAVCIAVQKDANDAVTPWQFSQALSAPTRSRPGCRSRAARCSVPRPWRSDGR
jgi:hypothetical protein